MGAQSLLLAIAVAEMRRSTQGRHWGNLPSLQDDGAAAALPIGLWKVVPDGTPDPAQMAGIAPVAWTVQTTSASEFGQLAVTCDETDPACMSQVSSTRQLVQQMEA
jgi:hypothetical protein